MDPSLADDEYKVVTLRDLRGPLWRGGKKKREGGGHELDLRGRDEVSQSVSQSVSKQVSK